MRALEGPNIADPLMVAIYKATEFSVANPTDAEKQQTNWVVRKDGTEVLKKEKHGAVLKLTVAEEWKGGA